MYKEKNLFRFYDISKLVETDGIRKRLKSQTIENALSERFPDEKIKVTSVNLFETGEYNRKEKLLVRILGFGSNPTGLPPFCEVKIEHQTGEFVEKIIVWSPLAWNDRFAGTAGGGTGTGGTGYISPANNTVRGWTLPFALINGFTTATADAGNNAGTRDLILNMKTDEIQKDLYENWRARTTHNMTIW